MAVDFLSRTMDKYPYNELVSPPFDLHQMDDAVDLALKKKEGRGGGKFTPCHLTFGLRLGFRLGKV